MGGGRTVRGNGRGKENRTNRGMTMALEIDANTEKPPRAATGKGQESAKTKGREAEGE